MDRMTPTLRPRDQAQVMWQRWAHLLFLHWEVPAEGLRRLLPPGLELDTYEGRAYVGLVPFTMLGIRPIYLPPVPPISNFHETNVRTYVHHKGSHPGVWFFSLDAASAVGVTLGRWLFHLPYHLARMRLSAEGETIDYETTRVGGGGRCHVRYAPRGEEAPAQPGTLEHFLAERYLLYAQGQGRLYRGQVHHAPYPLRRAEVFSLDEDLLAQAGIERPAVPPLAHYAREVTVRIYPLQRI